MFTFTTDSGGNMDAYIDDILIDSTTVSGYCRVEDYGYGYTGGSGNPNGYLGAFGSYSDKLTMSEVLQIYNSTKGKYK